MVKEKEKDEGMSTRIAGTKKRRKIKELTEVYSKALCSGNFSFASFRIAYNRKEEELVKVEEVWRREREGRGGRKKRKGEGRRKEVNTQKEVKKWGREGGKGRWREVEVSTPKISRREAGHVRALSKMGPVAWAM